MKKKKFPKVRLAKFPISKLLRGPLRDRRLKVFKIKGIKCVSCGKRGKFFALEKDGGGRLHIDLYTKDQQGREILMTIDHKKPKSKGGSNRLSNLQPMCRPCNINKADKYTNIGTKIFEFFLGVLEKLKKIWYTCRNRNCKWRQDF